MRMRAPTRLPGTSERGRPPSAPRFGWRGQEPPASGIGPRVRATNTLVTATSNRAGAVRMPATLEPVDHAAAGRVARWVAPQALSTGLTHLASGHHGHDCVIVGG